MEVSFISYSFPIGEDFSEYRGVKLLSVKEIITMKAYAIGRRATLKDYIDFYFAMKKDLINLQDLIEECRNKFGEGFGPRLFLERLVYLEDLEKKEINFVGEKVSKKEIVEFFKEEIRKLKI